jgi:hypothetical protein
MIFTGSFDSVKDIMEQFQITPADLVGKNILFASYDCGGYDGEAFVIFEENGSLYEVHGSHCSCYGLEGQWEPELTTKAALEMRLGDRSTLHPDIQAGLNQVLAKIGE